MAVLKKPLRLLPVSPYFLPNPKIPIYSPGRGCYNVFMPKMSYLVYRLLLLFVCFVLYLSAFSNLTQAENSLVNLVDILSNPLATASAEHAITFTLPTNSLPVYTTDYIHIYLADFTNLTAPTVLSGGYAGIPIYSVEPHWVHITGIALQPGGFLAIHGLTATNPPIYGDYQVQVLITSDLGRTQQKNGATTMASIFRGHVTVSAVIGADLAQLQISGYTAPGTFVIFTEAGGVIGTDVAGPTGYYSKVFSGLQPTTHRVSFYGIDLNNRTTSPINLEVYTPSQQLTAISGQLLSPTAELVTATVSPGNPLIASGSAIPNGALTIFTDSPLRTYYTSAAADGSWTYPLTDTSSYVFGDYRYYTLVQTGYGLQSLISHTLSFTVVSTDAQGSSCGDITQGDLNCDGNIDLTDFSILMYYWGTPNAAADINNDQQVNLTDFSILMYFWGT